MYWPSSFDTTSSSLFQYLTAKLHYRQPVALLSGLLDRDDLQHSRNRHRDLAAREGLLRPSGLVGAMGCLVPEDGRAFVRFLFSRY